MDIFKKENIYGSEEAQKKKKARLLIRLCCEYLSRGRCVRVQIKAMKIMLEK